MDFFGAAKRRMVGPAEALPGRAEPVLRGEVAHAVLGTPLPSDSRQAPHGVERAIFAMGCFWGAERIFWQTGGVYGTAVGYSGGYTPNPTYEEVCSGLTGHAEAVLVAYRPQEISYEQLLALFFESHDPTQGMRQGNDVGTQYRSAIYCTSDAQHEAALASRGAYQEKLRAAGYGQITTEIERAGPFYLAEHYHQQYLQKNPAGYDCHEGTGIACPVGLSVSQSTADTPSESSSR